MPTEAQSRDLFAHLQPGDRVEVLHSIKVGQQTWDTATQGSVIRTERRRQGLHFRRNKDDKAFCDLVVLRRDDGEMTTVTLDEYTSLKRI
jgi:hypothetical protein